jgi:hypothetical protein
LRNEADSGGRGVLGNAVQPTDAGLRSGAEVEMGVIRLGGQAVYASAADMRSKTHPTFGWLWNFARVREIPDAGSLTDDAAMGRTLTTIGLAVVAAVDRRTGEITWKT